MPSIRQRFILLTVSGLGVGYCPYFPGTIGTILAIPLSLALNRLASLSTPIALLTLVLATACAISLSTRAGEILRHKDPQIVVIDEIVGFLLANFAAPNRLSVLLMSFALFRFFDIAKVYPAARLERLPGGRGIVLDDVMAGVYTLAIMRSLLAWHLI